VEEKLFLAIADDTFADYRDPNNEAINDPNKGEEWGPERTLRADRIEWAWARSKVQRIALGGARIEGQPSLGRNKSTGVLLLIECYAPRGIQLSNARISSLSLRGTYCRHIMAQGIVVEKTADLNRVRVTKGGVNLADAEVGANLNLNGAYVENSSGYALAADRCKVGGNFNMKEGFVAVGAVSLNGARIDGQLNCLRWEGNEPKEFSLDLRDATAGTLWDERESWPAKGRLFLHGFVYDGIYDKATIHVDERLDWLHRQPDDRYRPQPYEQLAKVLQESGHDEAAKQILIAKEEERLRLTSMTGTARFLWWLWGWLMDYGYHPLKMLRGLVIVVLGWGIFRLAEWADYIRPCQQWAYKNGRRTKPQLVKEYLPFNSLLYSFELFIPAINLQYRGHWLPKCPDTEGKRFAIRAWTRFCYFCLWFWIIFEIISGWVILSMLIAGATLLIRS